MFSIKKSPKWGEMNVSQMMAHCTDVMRNALGETQQKRLFIGYLIAPFIRPKYYNNKPFVKRGGPSTFKIIEEKITSKAQ